MVYRMTVTPMLEEYGTDLCLSAGGILKLFENAATRHADAVGDSVSACLARGEAWVLSDWYVVILTRTPIGEKVRVETFCHKSTYSTGLMRDFRMKDEAGNVIALSTSKWARIRVVDGKLLPVDGEILQKYGALSRSPFGEFPKPPRHRMLPCTAKTEIALRRTDFDLYDHIHNLQYLDYAFEVIPGEVYNAHAVHTFHIRYGKPIRQGQRVTANCAETAWGYAVFIEADGVLCATVDLWT